MKVEDSTRADVSSIVIDKKILKKKDLNLKHGSLFYNMTFKHPKDSVEYTIEATLNMGWCPSGGSDRLRGGDFLTTTMYSFDVEPKIHVYEEDIELEFNPGSKFLCFIFHSQFHCKMKGAYVLSVKMPQLVFLEINTD